MIFAPFVDPRLVSSLVVPLTTVSCRNWMFLPVVPTAPPRVTVEEVTSRVPLIVTWLDGVPSHTPPVLLNWVFD